MGIVRFALRFPHTFYVVAALILFLGVAAIRSMPTDILPEINIPVVTVIWQYTGSPRQRWNSASPPTVNMPSARASPASKTWRRKPSMACRSRSFISSPTGCGSADPCSGTFTPGDLR
jgi:hypothetical protein